MIYARPRFSRGHGFGNRLFPWARARVFAAVNGARFVDPVWTRPAVGPLLRGGIALRSYRRQILLAGLFRRKAGDLDWVRGALRSRSAQRVAEPADPRASWVPPRAESDDAVVEFRGYDGFFAPLLGWGTRLHEELCAITRPKYLRWAGRFDPVAIALNVRCGKDFPRTAPHGGRLRFGEATPIPWFVETLRRVRETAGPHAALVVSDGRLSDLRALLQEPDVTFVRPGCAVSDLLTLSRARVLLASGSSSFSAWGAFLGGMPAASHPGQPLTDWRMPAREGGALRAEFDPGEPDPTFLAAADEALRAPHRAVAAPPRRPDVTTAG